MRFNVFNEGRQGFFVFIGCLTLAFFEPCISTKAFSTHPMAESIKNIGILKEGYPKFLNHGVDDVEVFPVRTQISPNCLLAQDKINCVDCLIIDDPAFGLQEMQCWGDEASLDPERQALIFLKSTEAFPIVLFHNTVNQIEYRLRDRVPHPWFLPPCILKPSLQISGDGWGNADSD